MCTICMEPFCPGNVAALLPCHHAFHEACAMIWLRQHGTCPIDRRDLTV
ncbi:unnamed protein product [Phaeothamnion confervicola]